MILIFSEVKLLWLGCSSVMTRAAMMRNVSAEARAWHGSMKLPYHDMKATPATNGTAIPAISLSTFISHLIFAKIAINFITLQR
jgi:hypothetical protein